MRPRSLEDGASWLGRRCGLLLAAIAVLLLASAPARGERYANGNVEVMELPQMVPVSRPGGSAVQIWQGYIEMRYLVRNLSATRPFEVELATQPPLVHRKVLLAPRQEMTVSLLLPVQHLAYSDQVVVNVDGRRQHPPVSSHGQYRDNDLRQQLELHSQGVRADFYAGHAGGGSSVRSDVQCRQWSSNYLAYLCFNKVVITGREQAEMPAGVLLALRRYAEVGGVVVVAPDKDESASARVDTELAQVLAEGSAGVTGFGRVTRGSPTEIDLQALGSNYLFKNYEGDLVLEMTPIPTRGLLVLVVVFALVVGPLNFFVLAIRRRRVWIWWTVPGIALLASGLIFGYAMLSEGTTGRSRCVAITILDENVARASTVGYLSYYCPLAPGPLDFSYETEVTPLGFDSSRYSGYRYRYDSDTRLGTIDLTRSQRFIGWLPARTARGFQVRKNEDRRERLPIRRTAEGNLAVVNGLGVTIEKLSLTDSDGVHYVGERIIAGQEQVLTRRPPNPQAGEAPPSDYLLAGWPDSIRVLTAEKVTPPGTYLALVGRTPFIEAPLDGVYEDGSYGLVYGISKREAE